MLLLVIRTCSNLVQKIGERVLNKSSIAPPKVRVDEWFANCWRALPLLDLDVSVDGRQLYLAFRRYVRKVVDFPVDEIDRSASS